MKLIPNQRSWRPRPTEVCCAGEAALVEVGDVIEVPEGSYQLGRGTLRLRVRQIQHRPGENLRERFWISLLGVELDPDGTDSRCRYGLIRHRAVIVRSTALITNPPRRG